MAEVESATVLLAGASGFAGGLTLQALLAATDVARVYAITRRPLGREHPRLANRIVQFAQIETQLRGLSCPAALCCLGSRMRDSAPEQLLRQVDVDVVMAFARAAKSAGVQRFVVLSCAGATAQARSPHLRVKAEMEAALATLSFGSLDILQPAWLLGWRRDVRPLELTAGVLLPLANPFLTGSRAVHRGIPARTVAAAMVGALRSGRRGIQRYTHDGIVALAKLKAQRALPVEEPRAPARPR